jgi:hypothetical protein
MQFTVSTLSALLAVPGVLAAVALTNDASLKPRGTDWIIERIDTHEPSSPTKFTHGTKTYSVDKQQWVADCTDGCATSWKSGSVPTIMPKIRPSQNGTAPANPTMEPTQVFNYTPDNKP